MAEPEQPAEAGDGSAGPLTCPRCARSHSLEERFCRDCGMPLVYAGRGEQAPITDAHGRARKIRPQYSRGELVRVAGGRNQAEAELIQGILLEEGIPSILRRTRGFDVPDFLAAGPRDVMVPEAGYEPARELLTSAELLSERDQPAPGAMPGIGSPRRLLVGVVTAALIAFLIVWALYQVRF
jgi:Putative prokaryotic signal transducing protein